MALPANYMRLTLAETRPTGDINGPMLPSLYSKTTNHAKCILRIVLRGVCGTIVYDTGGTIIPYDNGGEFSAFLPLNMPLVPCDDVCSS